MEVVRAGSLEGVRRQAPSLKFDAAVLELGLLDGHGAGLIVEPRKTDSSDSNASDARLLNSEARIRLPVDEGFPGLYKAKSGCALEVVAMVAADRSGVFDRRRRSLIAPDGDAG